MSKHYQFNTDKAILIVLAAILTIAAILFLRGCIHTPEKPVIIPAKKIIATVKEQEKAPNIAIAKADSNLVVLKKQVQTLTIQLAKAQQINRTLASHKPAPKDTATYADAIEDYVKELIASAATSDSICNTNIANYQQQLSNRDTAYNWQIVKYNMLKNNFDLATTQQQILEESNKAYRRALRRKKFSNVVWKAALIAAGGFIILKK